MTHEVALTVLGRVQRVVFVMYLTGQLSWMTSRFSNMARHGEYGNITLIQQLESIEDIFIIKKKRKKKKKLHLFPFFFFFLINVLYNIASKQQVQKDRRCINRRDENKLLPFGSSFISSTFYLYFLYIVF